MANECLNWLTIRADEGIEALAHFREAAQDSSNSAAVLSFKRFLPVPENRKGDEYRWCMRHWGTACDAYYTEIVCPNEWSILYTCVTKWQPPLVWLTAMIEQFDTLEFTLQYVDYGFPMCGAIVGARGSVLTQARSGIGCRR